MKESLLVNALGHSAGVLIFGIFLYLLIEDRAARRLRGGVKSILAAGLALAWNLGSLIVLGVGESGGVLAALTVAFSFSVLSLLPAVLFDLSLDGRHRMLVRMGYGLAGVSIALHVTELFRAEDFYHATGLTLITVGFGSLTAIAAADVFRHRERRAHTSRLIATMALFLLAMSFVHLGGGHAQQVWSQELAFHHAAIPLALLVLLQDYRFVLLDAFLRFLANVILAAVFVSGVAVAWNSGVRWPGDPFWQALLLAGACVLLVVFAMARQRVQRVLTRVVFRRGDDAGLLEATQAVVGSEEEYVARVGERMGEFVGAAARVVEDVELDRLHLVGPVISAEVGHEVIVPLRFPSGRARYVLLGRRSGGRRYLSEDLHVLGEAAAAVVEHVEQSRETEMRRLVAQAELRALQSQIHPHFLFNALNTLYGIIPREARGARDTVLNLADIFRYFLETRKTHVPLEEEMRIVRAYLEIERLRLGTKLATEFEIGAEAAQVSIPVLSIQPLVENAVKHGIAPLVEGGMVRVEACVVDGELRVAVRDTGRGFAENGREGVGLENVRRRLELSYGGEARLSVRSDGDESEVAISIPVGDETPRVASKTHHSAGW